MNTAVKIAGCSLASLMLAVILSLLPITEGYAASQQPYFKVFGGDVSTGGWFNNNTQACTASPNFQDDNYKPNGVVTDAAKSFGGIYTFAKTNGDYSGASSQFAAFSLGTIEGGTGGNNNGFYTGNVKNNNNPLSFANSGASLPPPNYSGGLWGGGQMYATNCIKDYYNTSLKTPNASFPSGGLAQSDINALPPNASITYTINSGASLAELVSQPINIPPGLRIYIFINGNIHIKNDIKFQAFTVKTIPRFTVVTQGNIYVDPNVSNLNGVYIAQPDPNVANTVSADTGRFWSCDDGSRSSYSTTGGASWIYQKCRTKLIINGAVIAKELLLFRVNGDVQSAPNNETVGSGNIAEEFNFTPETVLGGPILPDGSSDSISNGTKPVYDSVLNLPPTF